MNSNSHPRVGAIALVFAAAALLSTDARAQSCPPIQNPPLAPSPVPLPAISPIGQYFGWSAAAAGDVNGDCYADFVVGSQGDAYVMRGSSQPGSSSIRLVPSDGYLASNRVASGVGDLNGDGYDDVGGQQFWAHRAAVYAGGPNMNGTHDAQFTGDHGFSNGGPKFASSLDGGDFNGDGYDDLVVGEVSALFGSGAVYVYLGNANIFSDPARVRSYDAKLEPSSTSLIYGRSVRFLGDVNGDGYEDFGFSDTTARRAYVVYGNAAGSVFSRSTLSVGGSSPFGNDLAGGDVNGDGYDDVIVGGWSGNPCGVSHAWVFLGSPSGVGGSWAWRLDADSSCTNFGSTVDLADVTGDGRAEAIIGEPQYGGGADPPGRVLLYSFAYASPFSGGVQRFETYPGTSARDGWGMVLAAVGDTNRDGMADFVVGGADVLSSAGTEVVVHLGVIRCPTACPGDYTLDGVIDLADIGVFARLFNEGDLRADLTCDGYVNLADVGRMATLLQTGCP